MGTVLAVAERRAATPGDLHSRGPGRSVSSSED